MLQIWNMVLRRAPLASRLPAFLTAPASQLDPLVLAESRSACGFPSAACNRRSAVGLLRRADIPAHCRSFAASN